MGGAASSGGGPGGRRRQGDRTRRRNGLSGGERRSRSAKHDPVTAEISETAETGETAATKAPVPPAPAQRAALDTHFRPATYVPTRGDLPAVVTSSGLEVSFAELEERSCRLAQALFDYGLRPGDHVAILLPNDERTHEIVFGAQRSGLYFTMVNTHLTAEEAAYIVNDCGARTLVTSAKLGSSLPRWSLSPLLSSCA